MRSLLAHFESDCSGVTSIEYAFIGALVFLAIVTAIGTIGTELVVPFQKIGTSLTSANGG